MFQTEPILWLQSLGGETTAWLMWAVSELGTPNSYLLVLVVWTFGVDLRQGWLIGQMLLWLAGVTQYGKNLIALPRPLHVDSRVLYPVDGSAGQDLFLARGAESLLGALPPDVVTFYRGQPDVGWGLPSGHTSVFTSLAGGLAAMAGWRRWWLAALLGGSVMALSRLYLGRHFLADVVTGGLLGLGAVWVLARTTRPARASVAGSWLAARRQGLVAGWLFLAPAFFLPLIFTDGALWAAQLWAWNVGFWWLLRRERGYPAGRPAQRLSRVVLGLTVGFGSAIGIESALVRLGLEASLGAQVVGQVLAALLLVVGTTLIAERLGLYGEAAAPHRPARRGASSR